MCGIGGVMQRAPTRPIAPEVLVAMAAIQSHRGPDGFGWKVMGEGGVGFAHARLSIIDLNPERGRQPFISADGQHMIVHNGEFYDYKRIRADLTSRGYRFRSKSDSELMLHLRIALGWRQPCPICAGNSPLLCTNARQIGLHWCAIALA